MLSSCCGYHRRIKRRGSALSDFLPERASARSDTASRLCTARNSSTCGSMAWTPRARASKPSKRSSGLSQIRRRQDRCSRSISVSSSAGVVPLETIGNQKHDGALPEHPARPETIEFMQCFADPRAADQSLTARMQSSIAVIGITVLHLTRHVAQPCSEQERVDPAALFGQHMQKMQEDTGVLAHRAGNVGQHHQRRMTGLRFPKPRQDEIATGFHRIAHRCARVDTARPVRGAKTARRHLIHGQYQCRQAFFARQSRLPTSGRNPPGAATPGRTR